jgi:hypothetical protein
MEVSTQDKAAAESAQQEILKESFLIDLQKQGLPGSKLLSSSIKVSTEHLIVNVLPISSKAI